MDILNVTVAYAQDPQKKRAVSPFFLFSATIEPSALLSSSTTTSSLIIHHDHRVIVINLDLLHIIMISVVFISSILCHRQYGSSRGRRYGVDNFKQDQNSDGSVTRFS